MDWHDRDFEQISSSESRSSRPEAATSSATTSPSRAVSGGLRPTIEPSRLAGRATGESRSVWSAQMGKLFEPLQRNVAAMTRAAERARGDVDRLSHHARSAGAPRILQGAARLAQRKPAAFLGGVFLLGLFVLRALRRGGDNEVPLRSPLPFQRFDESRIPHDRPSGYFAARGEGTQTNTPQTRTIR